MASVLEALLECGVYALNRQKREALATELLEDGFLHGDVHALRDYLRLSDGDEGKAQRMLAGKLIEKVGRKDMLVDLRRHMAQRKPADNRDHDHGDMIRMTDMGGVRRFEANYAAWVTAKKSGTAPIVERLTMPWEVRRG